MEAKDGLVEAEDGLVEAEDGLVKAEDGLVEAKDGGVCGDGGRLADVPGGLGAVPVVPVVGAVPEDILGNNFVFKGKVQLPHDQVDRWSCRSGSLLYFPNFPSTLLLSEHL